MHSLHTAALTTLPFLPSPPSHSYIGWFDTAVEAAVAYAKHVEAFGESVVVPPVDDRDEEPEGLDDEEKAARREAIKHCPRCSGGLHKPHTCGLFNKQHHLPKAPAANKAKWAAATWPPEGSDAFVCPCGKTSDSLKGLNVHKGRNCKLTDPADKIPPRPKKTRVANAGDEDDVDDEEEDEEDEEVMVLEAAKKTLLQILRWWRLLLLSPRRCCGGG